MRSSEDEVLEVRGYRILPGPTSCGTAGARLVYRECGLVLNFTYLTMFELIRLEGALPIAHHGPVYIAWLILALDLACGSEGKSKLLHGIEGVQWFELADVWDGQVWECPDARTALIPPSIGRFAVLWQVVTYDLQLGADVVVSSGASASWWS
jgi:hypothetical protein